MANPGQELSSIDFESMIGGPLIAVVNAQAQSAMTTVDFIKSVGFEHNDTNDGKTGSPKYVTFKYPKEISPYVPAVPAIPESGTQGQPGYQPPVAEVPAKPAVVETHELNVPLLTMLPIPYLRVEEVKIDFNAKINSITSRSSTNSWSTGGSLEAGAQGSYSGIGGGVKMKVSASRKKTTASNVEVKRTYNLGVNVRAVQDEIPAGMERILGILEDVISF